MKERKETREHSSKGAYHLYLQVELSIRGEELTVLEKPYLKGILPAVQRATGYPVEQKVHCNKNK